MRMNLLTKQALPLARARILRFARCHAYTLSVAPKRAHIRASYHANAAALASASYAASLAANPVGSLMLRRP
jgi:hypothetical protein